MKTHMFSSNFLMKKFQVSTRYTSNFEKVVRLHISLPHDVAVFVFAKPVAPPQPPAGGRVSGRRHDWGAPPRHGPRAHTHTITHTLTPSGRSYSRRGTLLLPSCMNNASSYYYIYRYYTAPSFLTNRIFHHHSP